MKKKVNLLSKAELKNVFGGVMAESSIFCVDGPCSLTIQGSDGSYVTRNGECARDWFNTNACYCNAGLGATIPITSNDGVSRCWA